MRPHTRLCVKVLRSAPLSSAGHSVKNLQLCVNFYTIKRRSWSPSGVPHQHPDPKFPVVAGFSCEVPSHCQTLRLAPPKNATAATEKVFVDAFQNRSNIRPALLTAQGGRSDLFLCAHVHSSRAGAAIRSGPRKFSFHKKAAPTHGTIGPAK